MSKTSDKERNKEEVGRTLHQFQKSLTIILLFAIILISGFIIVYLINPKPGHVTFGILNEEQKAEDYPTSVKVGQAVNLYVYVGNSLVTHFSFRIKIFKGDENSQLSSSGSSNVNLDRTIGDFTLSEGEDWLSEKQSIIFNTVGDYQVIVIELWEIRNNNIEIFSNILWIRLNVTN